MQTAQPQSNLVSDEKIDLQKTLALYFRNWKWLVFSSLFFVVLGFIYLKYTTKTYESSARVLVKDDKQNSLSSGLALFEDLGMLSGSSNVQNEIEILKSRTLITSVAKSLRLNINYFYSEEEDMSGEIMADELPFVLTFEQGDSSIYAKEGVFSITPVSDKTFRLEGPFIKKNGEYSLGSIVPTRAGNMQLSPTNNEPKKWFNHTIQVDIKKMGEVISELQKLLVADGNAKESSLIVLRLKGENIEKNNLILDELIAQHEQRTVEAKNKVSDLTSSFINDRLTVISEELSDVENKGESFKTQHNLTDITSDVTQYLEKQSNLEKEVTEATIQLKLAQYMNEYIKSHTGYDVLLPANIGFDDMSIAEMTSEYNTLVLSRNELLKSSSEKNPSVIKIEAQLSSLKNSLVASLKNIQSTLELKLKSLESEERIYNSKLSAIPAYERTYRDIARQQQIKETLYLYLLQKREENEIARTATIGNIEVIDNAYSSGKPVSPKKMVVLAGAFLLGLLLPIGIIYVRNLLDNKVRVKEDIEAAGLTFVGDIPMNESKDYLVAVKGARTAISEAFRMLRTNVSFVLNSQDENGKVIYVTSTVAGEGKSFTSLNLAHSLALTDKKVALVGLDLRSPKLAEYIGIPEQKGITNFLVDKDLTLDRIVIHSQQNENLFYYISGPVPPNPSELLLKKRLQEVFTELREKYDYIVVDTAPAALVIDTLSIAQYADMTLFISRANYLEKRMLDVAVSHYRNKKFPNLVVALNGTKVSQSSYGYGYGYGHETSKDKGRFKKRFKRN